MKDDLISREEALRKLAEYGPRTNATDYDIGWEDAREEVTREIKALPAVDAEPVRPGERLYISIDTWVDDEGQRKWSGPLSDAQMYAYWNHTIGPMQEEAGKIYCIIYYTESGGVKLEE